MKTISFSMETNMLNLVDKLIEIGYFPSRSEFLRLSVRKMLKEELISESVINFLSTNDKDFLKKITDLTKITEQDD